MVPAEPSLASLARAVVGERSAASPTVSRKTVPRVSRSPGCSFCGTGAERHVTRHGSPSVARGKADCFEQKAPRHATHQGGVRSSVSATAPKPRTDGGRSSRCGSPPPERGGQRSPRLGSPVTSKRVSRVSAIVVPPASTSSRVQASPHKPHKLQDHMADSSCLEGDSSEAPDSPRTITEAALQKSQMLLDKLLSLDFAEANVADATCDLEAEGEGEAQGATRPPSAWPWPTQSGGPTAEVPVEFLSMLAEMWDHLKEERQQQTGPLAPPPLEICVDPTAAKKPGSSPSLSSPGSTRLLTGSSSPTSSIESPGGSSVMSQWDKAQLIRELREVLHASLAPKVATLSPVLSFRNPVSVRPALPRAAVSPRYRPTSASPQWTTGAHAVLASPPRTTRAHAATSPPGAIRAHATMTDAAANPSCAVFAQQPRHIVLQPVALTNAHRVLAAC